MTKTLAMFVAWLPWIRSRAPLLVAAAGFAAGHRCATAAPPAADLRGLTALLASAAAAEVEPGALAWEPSRGALWDFWFGRQVLFLGAKPGQPRELYRTAVTLTWEGKPLTAGRAYNLSNTPLADELGLQVSGPYAAFSSVYAGQAAVSVLDTRGALLPGPWSSRLLSRAVAEQRFGTYAGLQATHFAWPHAERLRVTLTTPQLQLAWGQNEAASYDLEQGKWLNSEPTTGVLVWQPPATPANPRDAARELAHGLLGKERAQRWGELFRAQRPPPALPPSLDATLAAAGVGQWPPAPLAAKAAAPWRPLTAGPALQPNEPALLYASQVPLVNGEDLQLVALDLRRLELRVAPGYEQPRAHTGPGGPGRIPAAELSRAVAAFNGGPSAVERDATAVAPGLISEGRVLVPPQRGLPAVATTQSGWLGLGSAASNELPGVVSLRQTGPALIDAGKPDAAQSPSAELSTERSALCRTQHGHVFYGWAQATTRYELIQGLLLAGCYDALELDNTPGALGLALFSPTPSGVSSALVHERMALAPDVHLAGSARDFFYLVRKNNTLEHSELDWQVSPGAQPEPSYIPGLFSTRRQVGDLNVELFLVEAERVQWRITAGQGEPLLPSSAAPTRALDADEQGRALFAFTLGHTTRATRYGLSFDARETLPLRRVYPTLVLRERGGFEVLPEGQQPAAAAGTTQVQLPALAKQGELTARAKERGAQRLRGALCVTPGGKLLAAFVEHDGSAPLAMLLLELGCAEVLELDRASQHAATFYRSGTQLQLPGTSEASLLVGLSRPMAQRTFRLADPPL